MFSKQKSKLDPKVRFQNQSFKNQLTNARNYKRTARKLPDAKWEIYLDKIGLGRWWAKSLAVLILLGVFYIIYVPNFFYIKHIGIIGLKTDAQQPVNNTVNAFLKSNRYFPQNNLLLFSKTKLANRLLSSNPDIYRIVDIKKQWPNTINLELEPRVGKFIAEIQDKKFIISNDGIVLGEVPSSTPATNLITVKFNKTDVPLTSNTLLTKDLISAVTDLNYQLPKIIGLPVDRYELTDPGSLDLNVYTASGFKLNFDVESNANDALRKLNLLFSGISDADRQKLYYIDMRFENKSYVCFKNTPCVKDIVISGSEATTTPTSTPIQ